MTIIRFNKQVKKIDVVGVNEELPEGKVRKTDEFEKSLKPAKFLVATRTSYSVSCVKFVMGYPSETRKKYHIGA